VSAFSAAPAFAFCGLYSVCRNERAENVKEKKIVEKKQISGYHEQARELQQ
jgi:hypothetical protein